MPALTSATQYMPVTIEYTSGDNALTLPSSLSLQVGFGKGTHAANLTSWGAYPCVGDGSSGQLLVNTSGNGDGTGNLPISQFEIDDDLNGISNQVSIQSPSGTSFNSLTIKLYIWADVSVLSGDEIKISANGIPAGLTVVVYNTDDNSNKASLTQAQPTGILTFKSYTTAK
jgi:hypothetical protein